MSNDKKLKSVAPKAVKLFNFKMQTRVNETRFYHGVYVYRFPHVPPLPSP